MTIVPAGVIAVPTPGTPVPLTTDITQRANKIVVSQNAGGLGKTYLKYLKGQPAAGTKVRVFIVPGAAGLVDEHSIYAGEEAGNPLVPSDWAIDADNAAEGMVVYWVTV